MVSVIFVITRLPADCVPDLGRASDGPLDQKCFNKRRDLCAQIKRYLWQPTVAFEQISLAASSFDLMWGSSSMGDSPEEEVRSASCGTTWRLRPIAISP